MTLAGMVVGRGGAPGQSLPQSDPSLGRRRWPTPYAFRGTHRPGKFGPFTTYALERWQAGVQDGTQLYAELKERGYRGTLRTVQRYLQALRQQRRPIVFGPPSAVDAFDARKVACPEEQ